ncbi:Rieske 2Fe-2S domain-containing protein [Solirubrobacter sp. CPCC 204708]|uniref:Rieske 2Fe-2S domain-containing protein n=1 Tax=Solirubrobacter deserti TaxID=2282478 RepID=A0ABT4RED2_9ACTN|nr:Rieske 2Fe-2S domain-containing protein [Solirubrobacter deserti]MBE2316149.1 Rieske 2Fe-2S domain-containing protein [Solirubrobacter deserti]MDA0136899.1 Rieske 2Fe-2S domain-containing protein [Solirubrobacter deserti]
MGLLRNEPEGRAVPTAGALPPVTHGELRVAAGDRLVDIDALGDRGVVEVRTAEHGVLAVGMAGGEPFAVSNVCRHQFAKLGRGQVTEDGCLECPWHRARFNVHSGSMTSGPKGRVFGFKPYSAAVRGFGEMARLKTYPVTVREGAIWLR